MIFLCKPCGILWTRIRTIKMIRRNDAIQQTCPDCLKINLAEEEVK